MTDLNSLVVFAEVVEANSFSEAARRLKMPTSTVSRRIAELEDQLGVRLLERSTRRLRLTDVGSEVLEHAQRSAELCEAIDNIASNHLSRVSGTLRLSAPPGVELLQYLSPLRRQARPSLSWHDIAATRTLVREPQVLSLCAALRGSPASGGDCVLRDPDGHIVELTSR